MYKAVPWVEKEAEKDKKSKQVTQEKTRARRRSGTAFSNRKKCLGTSCGRAHHILNVEKLPFLVTFDSRAAEQGSLTGDRQGLVGGIFLGGADGAVRDFRVDRAFLGRQMREM